jgi:sortase (surface protein transpeptidase)
MGIGRSKLHLPRGSPGRWLALGLLPGVLVACAQAAASVPEPQTRVRLALVPTFTPLPPPTATLTPIPSATATAPYATPTPDEFEAAGPPVRLEIPAIGVDAAVETVGRLPNDEIDVPKLPGNVAWFDESARPGQSGKPAIISGHLDSRSGPAVFWDLRKLLPGDELVVTYANGARHVFAVDDKERYFADQLPVQKLLGRNPRRMLNLITCDGAWDRGHASYVQRLAVYTRYKGPIEADANTSPRLNH